MCFVKFRLDHRHAAGKQSLLARSTWRVCAHSISGALYNLALASGLCQAMAMAKKRTKADIAERQTEQLGKRVDRHPDEIEKKPSTLAPKSDEPTVLIPIEQQIQQRAYELYEQRGRTDGYDLDDWLQAESEIKGTQANAAAA